MGNMFNVEIEYQTLAGETVERTFERCYNASFDYTTGVQIRTAAEQFILRDTSRVVRYEQRTVESTVSDWRRRDLDADVRQLLRDGQKIAAIKLVRTVLGYDLRNAKHYVENLPEPGADYSDIPF